MTNEVAAAAEMPACVSERVVSELENQLTQGQELWANLIAWLSEKGISFLINVIAAILILIAGMVAIRLIRKAVAKALSKVNRMSKLLSDFIVSVVSKTCWTVLALVILQRLGVNVGPLVAGLGVTGFILGFAFQETLGSFAAGMMIALNQPFKVGDYVVAGGIEGEVLELNMMATVFATADNKKVVIPNKSAWGSPITNFSALGVRRVDIRIGIDYGCDISKAVAVALKTIREIPGVLAEPAPEVTVASLDDSQVTLNVRPWAKGSDYWRVYDSVQQSVKSAFEVNGVDIPFPQLTVHVDK